MCSACSADSSTSILWERRDECPEAVLVLACHDEIVVECSVEQAGAAKARLEKAMMEGMDAQLNRTGEVYVAVEVELRVASPWEPVGREIGTGTTGSDNTEPPDFESDPNAALGLPRPLKYRVKACANRRAAYVPRHSRKAVQLLWELPSMKSCQPIGAAS